MSRRPLHDPAAAWRWLLLLGLAFAAGCARAPADPGLAADRLLAPRRAGAAPGAAALVIRDGEVVKRGAFGLADLEHGVPIGPHTAFRLASVSKQFTAMVVLMLAEEGRLRLDDPVARFVPELSRFGPALTIRHLLNHTGGLPDYYDVLIDVSGVPRPRASDAVAVLASWGEPRFAPGERFEYSNPGYEVLAVVIERASGRSYAELVEERILRPLGMLDSVVAVDGSTPIPHRAWGYRQEGFGYALDDDDPLNDLLGSDGVYSSVDDLARWDRALAEGRLVAPETLAEAYRPARLADGEDFPYGFGWSLEDRLGRRCLSHTGSWVGFRNFIARYPDDRTTVIVLSNYAETNAERLGDELAALYLPRAGTPGAAR